MVLIFISTVTIDEHISINCFFNLETGILPYKLVCAACMHIQGVINFPIYEKGILSCTHKILHDDDTHTSEHVVGSECYQVEEGQRRPFLVGHSSWQGHKDESEGLPVAK